MTFQLTHLAEVQRWILGYGAGCEVMELKELRAMVREEMGRAISVYEE